MKYIFKSLPYLITALTLTSFYFAYEKNLAISTLLFGVTLVLILFFYLRLISQSKKTSTQLMLDKKLNLGELFEEAANKLIEKSKTVDNLLLGIEQIQTGDLTVTENLQLNGRERDAITSLQMGLVKMKEQEQQQSWIMRGTAQIGDIRKMNLDLQNYAQTVLNSMVKYAKGNQGFFYLNERNTNSLKLLASYAFQVEQVPQEKTSIDIGSGLVGQCLKDRELMVITDIPSGYIKIKSGLGGAKPRCITLLPLIFREEIYGVIELASFRKFEAHQIEYIQKVAETIAAEIAASIQNETNAKLLKQSQEDAVELKLREEKSREKEEQLLLSMKELQDVQERLKDQESELKQQLMQVLVERRKNQAILEGCIDGVISFGENGKIQFLNAAAVEIFGFRRSELLMKPLDKILDIQIRDLNEGKALTSPEGELILLRTTISGKHKSGSSLPLLISSAKVKLDNEFLFTLFVQDHSVTALKN